MMTPEVAIQILTVSTANLQATRQQHQEIAAALQVIQQLANQVEMLTKKPAEAAKPADQKPELHQKTNPKEAKA